MTETQKTALFAVEGFRIKRNNPDGTMAAPQRTLGFVGLIDITAAVDALTKRAKLAVKLGAGEWVEKDIDFSSGVSLNSVSPENAAAKLTAAGYTGVTFSVDSTTGRLKAAATGANELQIKGVLAGALDFGGCRKYGGFGVYYLKFFDDETMSLTMPINMKEKEDIDLEGAKGTITRVTIPAKRLGMSPVITMKFKNNELRQIIQGGEWIPRTAASPAIYRPPLSDVNGSPIFMVDVFTPRYYDGTSQMEQVSGFDRDIFFACTGTEGEVPRQAKAWATFAYNLNAAEYTDENGVRHAQPENIEISISEFETLNVYKV